MARYRGPRGGRRTRNRFYPVLALIVIIGIFILIYGPFGNNEPTATEAAGLHADSSVQMPDLNQSGFGTTGNYDNSPPARSRNNSIDERNSRSREITPAPAAPSTTNTVTEPARILPEPSTLTEPVTGQESITRQEPVVRQETVVKQESIVTEIPAASAVKSDPQVDSLIAQATKLSSTPGKTIEARKMFNDILQMRLSEKQKASVKENLSQLTKQWLFSTTVWPGDTLCDYYQVQRGDSLEIIGKRFKVPYEIIQQINGISNPRLLMAGQRLKIVKGPFNAKVYRPTYTLDIYLQDTFVKSYKVGLGTSGSETPTGRWKVKDGGKLIKPVYTAPDGRLIHPEEPDYPLGSRWIALEGLNGEAVGKGGFGIHGTKDPDSIGKASSEGCIRLHNGQAIEVYNFLFPLFSTVSVED